MYGYGRLWREGGKAKRLSHRSKPRGPTKRFLQRNALALKRRMRTAKRKPYFSPGPAFCNNFSPAKVPVTAK